MALLTPIFLLGLLAALIPVAIHLIRRDNPPQVVFSTLRFFEQTQRKQFFFQRFQQWLLLLLRALVVALIALAFARPFFSQSISSAVDIAPKSVVVALDTSMSMSYENYFEKAKSEAREFLNTLNPGDEATLILFADEVQATYGPTTDFSQLTAVLNGLDETSYQSTRLLPALRLANDVLKNSQFNEKSIYVFSDFQTGSFQNAELNSVDDDSEVQSESTYRLDPGVALFLEQAPFDGDKNKISEKAETKNLAITGVRAPAYVRLESGNQESNNQSSNNQNSNNRSTTNPDYFNIYVGVRSLGNVKVNQSTLKVFIDQDNGETEVANVPIDLTHKSEQVITVPVPILASAKNTYRGKVVVDDNNFATDNTGYFTIDVLPPIQVFVLNGEASNNWYDDESHWFRLALSPNDLLKENASAAMNNSSPAQTSTAEIKNEGESKAFQVAAMSVDVLSRSSADERNAIEQINNADVVVLLNTHVDNNEIKSALQRYTENGGSVFMALGDRVRARNFNENLSSLSPASLINRHIFSDNDYLFIADVEKRHPILQPIDIDWTARFDGFWRMKPAEDAKVIMTFDNGEPALIEKNIGQGKVLVFGSTLDVEWNNFPLQAVYLPFVQETLQYLSQTPDKKSSYRIGDFIDAEQLTEPGFVEKNSQIIAVNTPANESNLQTLNTGDILDAVLNPETTPTQSASVKNQLLKATLEKPQRLWWWILLAVVCLFVAESLVANRTHR